MEDVQNYIKKYWIGFSIVLGWLIFFAVSSSIQPVSTGAMPAQATEQSNVSSEILAIHKQIEALQKQDSAIIESIQKVDSLRMENARTNLHKSVRSHYGDLSKRYANDPRIK